jgi:hypothetical protein
MHDGASRTLWLPAALGGGLLGLGLGFRPDVLVCAPALVMVITFAAPGFHRQALGHKAAALAIAGVTFVVSGWPVLSNMAESGNNSSHVIILGLTTSFNRTLDLTPAPYDMGNTYSDGFAYALITAHATLVQHEPQPVLYGSASYDLFGHQLLADVATRFPADVVIRALGATVQVLGYPFDPAARLVDLDSKVFGPLPGLKNASEHVGSVLDSLSRVAVWLPLAIILTLWTRSRRVGLSAGLLLLYFCGYSMLQFSRRHTFHLDVVAIGFVVVAFEWTVRFVRQAVQGAGLEPADDGQPNRRWLAIAVPHVLTAALGVGGTVLMFCGMRMWQQHHVMVLLDRTLELPWDRLQTNDESLSETAVRQGVPTRAWAVAYAAHWEQWNTATLIRVPPRPVSPQALAAKDDFLETSYLQVAIDNSRCEAPSVRVGLKYSAYAETAQREFTRVFDIARETAGGMTRILTPVYEMFGPYWSRFDGIAVPAEARSCIVDVERASSIAAVPLPILVAVLTPSWKARPLYQQLRGIPGITTIP